MLRSNARLVGVNRSGNQWHARVDEASSTVLSMPGRSRNEVLAHQHGQGAAERGLLTRHEYLNLAGSGVADRVVNRGHVARLNAAGSH